MFLLAATATAQEHGVLLFQGNEEEIETKMNAAADDGYRFAAVEHRTVATGMKKPQILVLMQKSPDTAGDVRYRVLRRSRSRKLEEDLSKAAKEGYRIVGTTSLNPRGTGANMVVVLKRRASASE